MPSATDNNKSIMVTSQTNAGTDRARAAVPHQTKQVENQRKASKKKKITKIIPTPTIEQFLLDLRRME